MAREHHQKSREKTSLLRKEPFSRGCDRILIITEGEKTELHYFDRDDQGMGFQVLNKPNRADGNNLGKVFIRYLHDN